MPREGTAGNDDEPMENEDEGDDESDASSVHSWKTDGYYSDGGTEKIIRDRYEEVLDD